jgi:TolB-like protein/DNA-binding winged helix-turn-helix (wHTH) protein
MDTLEKGFGLKELRVDPQSGEVSGPGGREKLDRKVMDVLLHMARHAGHVVARKDLLASLWPGTVVTDDALTRCFYELRRHLSHAGGDERYRELVETLPKRGYRLNGTVVPLAPDSDIHPSGPRKRLPTWAVAAGAAILLAVIAVLLVMQSLRAPTDGASNSRANSIAVLPFLDMSAEKDQGYLAYGVTEEILDRLTQSDNLIVIARTSSFSLQDESLDVPTIGKRLDVAYVLEGSVRKAGDRLRITAQLIDVSSNAHVWSQTYDRTIDDIFAVQDEIAESVATAMQVTLAGLDQSDPPPANVDAYERFLHGQFFYNRRAPGDIERAVDEYKQAVALDPAFARAWAALAGGYSLLYAEVKPQDHSLRDLQGEAARKAVELGPALAVAHARLAQYYYHVQQLAKGDEHMRTAVALDPDDLLVMGFGSSGAIWRGDYGEALNLWRQIVARDPLSSVSRTNLAIMLLLNGQLEESLTESRRSLELNPNAGENLDIDIVRALVLLERYDEAVALIARLPYGKGRDYAMALLYNAPGRKADADAALKRLSADSTEVLDRVRLAEVYAFRGMTDQAFDLLMDFQAELERNQASQPRAPWYFQNEIRTSALLKPLHSDPRWTELTKFPG